MDEGKEKIVAPVLGYSGQQRGWKFKEVWWRKRMVPAWHLGEDVLAEAGTPVNAVADGEVVFSRVLAGKASHRSWGGLVVLRHNDNYQLSMINFQSFYSVYGHLRDLSVQVGDQVVAGQGLGEIAPGLTAENGWWREPHLHFGIYTGPWRGEVLPGWWKLENFWRTRLSWWQDPAKFKLK